MTRTTRLTARLRTRPARCLLAALAAALMLLTGVGVASLAGAAPAQRWTPRPVIVDVTGTSQGGYGVYFADGDAIFPPTDSEMLAECAEYDTQLARVRCRVEARTWYRDLGDLKRSLAWARSHH